MTRLPAPWRARLCAAGRLFGSELQARPVSTAGLLACLTGVLGSALVALARAAATGERRALAVAALAPVFAAAVQGARRDARWLRTAGVDGVRLFAAEYALLAAPVAAALAAARRPGLALAAVGAAVACAWAPAGGGAAWWRRRDGRPRRRFPLPPDAFEWAAGLRRSGVVIAGAGAVALTVLRPGAALAGVAVVALTSAEFYVAEHEGWELVAASGRTPRALLARKAARAAGLCAAAAVPCVAAAFGAWALGRGTRVDALAACAALAAASLLPAAAAVAKYAAFAPGPRPPLAVALVLLGLAALALFPPALLGVAALLWRAAERRIAPYAHGQA